MGKEKEAREDRKGWWEEECERRRMGLRKDKKEWREVG